MIHKFLFILFITTTIHLSSSKQCDPPSPDNVTSLLPNLTGTDQPCMYAGFAPLDEKNDSALFYWYFPTESADEYDDTIPVIVYLRGLPGQSTTDSVFFENGPFTFNQDGDTTTIEYRADNGDFNYWSRNYSVLYIDSPVGAGYSYTTDGSTPTDLDQVSEQLYTGIQWFMDLHSTVENKSWYIAGESYGGRYAAALAHSII